MLRPILLCLILAAYSTGWAANLTPLSTYLAEVAQTRSADYVGQPGYVVSSAAEFKLMKDYLLSYYQGVKVVRSFLYSNDGAIIDCVDKYTQPAAQRYGLTAANWVSAPSHLPKKPKADAVDEPELKDPGIFLNGVDRDMYGNLRNCPNGSIVFNRLNLDHMAEAFTTFKEFLHGGKTAPMFSTAASANGHEYADAYYDVTNWGMEAKLGIWESFIDDTATEVSINQIWVVSGSSSGSTLDTVEAGTLIYPKYFFWHPNKPHLFIYSTSDNYKKTGCYNTDCNDFVVTDKSVDLGGTFSKLSTVNGTLYTSTILWQKDGNNGDWWLAVGGVYAGYYPRSIFDDPGLKKTGSTWKVGGEITNSTPSGRHTMTDMGSGYQPSSGYGYAAYDRNLQYVDTTNTYVVPSSTKLWTIVNNSSCYNIAAHFGDVNYGTYFYFGGEGLNSSTCP